MLLSLYPLKPKSTNFLSSIHLFPISEQGNFLFQSNHAILLPIFEGIDLIHVRAHKKTPLSFTHSTVIKTGPMVEYSLRIIPSPRRRDLHMVWDWNWLQNQTKSNLRSILNTWFSSLGTGDIFKRFLQWPLQIWLTNKHWHLDAVNVDDCFMSQGHNESGITRTQQKHYLSPGDVYFTNWQVLLGCLTLLVYYSWLRGWWTILVPFES